MLPGSLQVCIILLLRERFCFGENDSCSPNLRSLLIAIAVVAVSVGLEDEMDINRLVIQLVVALVCAGIASILVPRRIPGKLLGLFLVGLGGVWVGEWGYTLIRQQYGIQFDFLSWNIEGVAVIPAIIGSAIVLYVLTAFLKWGRYST